MNGQQDIRDLKPWMALAEVPVWAIIVALLLGLAAAFWLWRRKRKKALPETVVLAADPGPTPWERLVAQRSTPLADKESIRLFHFGLSEAFRAVLEEHFKFPASDRTTEELKRGLRGVVPELGKVVSLLEAADLVKFTDYRPTEEASRALLEDAVRVAESWKPQDEPEPAGSARREERLA